MHDCILLSELLDGFDVVGMTTEISAFLFHARILAT
jgi:hypothetical protein